jgi:hypothetical protein
MPTFKSIKTGTIVFAFSKTEEISLAVSILSVRQPQVIDGNFFASVASRSALGPTG